jgi:dTDP-4-dehydrorhamnose reductase
VKILVTGARGKVGRRLAQCLPSLGETVALDRSGLDLSRPDSIRETIRAVRPDVIVNAAGYTLVDAAESQPALAHAINAVAPGVIAEEAKRLGALLVHFSTVYVFDGTKTGAYVENDTPHPINEYGLSKLRGEQAIAAVGGEHLILRASWVYDTVGREDFVLAMLRLAAERESVNVVDDQLGCPTWANALAETAAQALTLTRAMKAAPGLYNLAALGAVSRFDFAARLLELTPTLRAGRARTALHAIKTSEFPLVARRPLNSALASDRIASAGVRLASWEDQLQGFVRVLGPQR